MIGVVDGEPLPAPAVQPAGTRGVQYLPVLVIVVLALGGFGRMLFGRLPGAAVTGGVTGLLVWLVMGALALAVPIGFFAFLFTLASGHRWGGSAAAVAGLEALAADSAVAWAAAASVAGAGASAVVVVVSVAAAPRGSW